MNKEKKLRDREFKKYYTIAYALTAGIELRELQHIETGVLGSGKYRLADHNNFFRGYTLGKDAFLTKEEARAACFEVGRKKVEKLRNQIEKILGKSFEEVKDRT